MNTKLKYPIPNRLIEENLLDYKDYRVLHGLCEGRTYKEIAEYVGVSEKVVNDRIRFMEESKILLRRSFPLIDLIRIWNHVYLAQVKLQLAAPVRLAGIPAPPAWEDIISTFQKIGRERFNSLVRFAFVPFGTEYDLILLVTAQSLDEYSKFFADLQREANIERVWGSEAVPLAGMHFNPIGIPDPEMIETSIKEMLTSKLVKSLQG